jgi:hypothetical protein
MLMSKEKQFNIRVSESLFREIEKVAKETDHTKSTFARLAIKILIRNIDLLYGKVKPDAGALPADIESAIGKILEDQGKMLKINEDTAKILKSPEFKSTVDEKAIALRMRGMILDKQYRDIVTASSTIDHLAEEIKGIDPSMEPFLTPSPDRPVTILEVVLIGLSKEGLLQKKSHGSLVWNREGFETLADSRR